jgi:glycosyltransferase involved in cell wall biosynthesis
LGKRVLLVITGAFFLNGGIARVNQMMIESLVQNDYELEIFSLLEGGGESQKWDRNIITYRQFSNNKIKFTLKLWQAILSRKFNLVIVDHINLSSILAPLSVLGICKYTVWLFGIEVMPPRPDKEGIIGLKYASRRIAISEFTKEIVHQKHPNLRVDVCTLSLNKEESQISIRTPDISKYSKKLVTINGLNFEVGKKVILTVARMVKPDDLGRDKGQSYLLNSFPLISNSVPEAQLILVGEGQDYEYFLSLAKNLPDDVQPKICMPGSLSRNELWCLMSCCNIFAMPSSGEGFGLVYLEAMAWGKPCIGLRKDATPYLIKEGENGLLVDYPLKISDLSEKIIYLLKNPDIANEMGLRGKEMVIQNYLFDQFSHRFIELLES